ncbi:hypothetical protein [Paenibacillus sp. UNC496MF]|uniref:phage neck terminator protein n=1 Tax=Paenibacillus sp. UNC496MF TaxID=1502753 RepID=UPI000B889D4D|nr:hypothetical protein [Paenibacillus sp. UNC496MF]
MLIPILNQVLGVPVIEANSEGEPPPGSFITFKSLQPMGRALGQPIETLSVDRRKIVQQDIVMTMTFTMYGEDKGECIELAVKAAECLQTDGYRALKDAGIVLVELGEMTANDLKLGDTWERRTLFDADFRMTHTMTAKTAIETIETADVKGVFLHVRH